MSRNWLPRDGSKLPAILASRQGAWTRKQTLMEPSAPVVIECCIMSDNDRIHLDSNFQNWKKERAEGLKVVDSFLYYCMEQFVKPFGLSDEEILYGITDGPNDGGVDGIYFLVNRGILVFEDTEIESKSTSSVHLIIIQQKSDEGFKPTEINKLTLFTDDLLNLSLPASSLTTKYHPQLIEIMRTFKEKYLSIAGGFPTVTIDYFYITKGDELKPDKNAQDAAAKVKETVNRHLSKADCNFHFINLQSLLEQVMRRPPREKTLVWAESPMQTEEGFVGLVKLDDYFRFIQDEYGGLADRIFESNVRGFQQSTPVNVQIRDSLRSTKTANFWLLNNGITIIAAKTQNAGHLRLNLEDPQVVNGLQTSREVFNYFSEIKPQDEKRSILVKVIETDDAVVRDATIKATNSQNKMPPASLRATDPIHNQIEDLFKQYDLYYDRRKGFYRDQGKPIRKIVSVTELVQAVVSVILQRPDDARARPGNYIKSNEKYESVFGENCLPLGVYLTCVRLVRRLEQFFDSAVTIARGDERNVKFYVVAYLACRQTTSADPYPDDLVAINVISIDDRTIKDCFDRVLKKYKKLGANDTVARGSQLLKSMRSEIRRKYLSRIDDRDLGS